MDMGVVLAADKSCKILCKSTIGQPLKHQLPQFNGNAQTTLVGRPIKSVTSIDFFWSLPLFGMIRRLVEPALETDYPMTPGSN